MSEKDRPAVASPCMFEGCTLDHAGEYPLCPEHLAAFIEYNNAKARTPDPCRTDEERIKTWLVDHGADESQESVDALLDLVDDVRADEESKWAEIVKAARTPEARSKSEKCGNLCQECETLGEDAAPSECICHWCLIRHMSHSGQVLRHAIVAIKAQTKEAAVRDLAAKALDDATSPPAARTTSAQSDSDAPKRCEKEALYCHFREKKLVESVERLKKRLDDTKAEQLRFAAYISSATFRWPKDHACAECVPCGEIVIQGFRCVPHAALALRGLGTDERLPPEAYETPPDPPGPYIGKVCETEDGTERIRVFGCYGIGSGGLLYGVSFPNALDFKSPNGMSASEIASKYPRIVDVFRSTHHAPTKNGRVLAERCCTCSVEGCGRPTGRYIGGRGECELHLAEKNYARAVEQAEGAAEWLTKAKARLAAAKARSERAKVER